MPKKAVSLREHLSSGALIPLNGSESGRCDHLYAPFQSTSINTKRTPSERDKTAKVFSLHAIKSYTSKV